MAGRKNLVPADVRLETQSRLTARGMRNPTSTARYDALAMMVLQFGQFMPVLAGDTLKSASIMGRIVSAPTSTALAAVQGHWFEQWLFYVRAGDLSSQASAFRDYISAASGTAPTYANLVSDLKNAVFQKFFTDEDEAAGAGLGWRLRWPGSDWFDTAVLESALPAEDTVNNDLWEEQWIRYQQMRRARLTTNTFEEYLAKQGVAAPVALRAEHDPELKMPELLHYSREFAYPQPTTNPTGTALAHSVQWFIQSRLQRGRFFAEPGFLVPCWAVRPKVLLAPTTGAVADPLNLIDLRTMFMPPEYDTDPHTSIVEVPAAQASPSGDTVPGSAPWVVDAREFLLRGADAGSAAAAVIRTPDRRPTATQVSALPTYTVDMFHTYRIASRINKDTTF
ncbi:MAG: major capsid protein [Circular genetic element sp.]|nr:MAG: major capsid protein [Circular genetic element sp.]